ncbi:hypothetical protein EKN23_22635 [Enterobacter hormaechei]|nr:hypothetical protein EKN23_22635 [Enterobacter hormaechei]
MPENPASYRVVRTKSYLFNKAIKSVWKYRGQSTKVFFVNSGINQHRLMFLVLCEFTVCSLIRNSL